MTITRPTTGSNSAYSAMPAKMRDAWDICRGHRDPRGVPDDDNEDEILDDASEAGEAEVAGGEAEAQEPEPQNCI